MEYNFIIDVMIGYSVYIYVNIFLFVNMLFFLICKTEYFVTVSMVLIE